MGLLFGGERRGWTEDPRIPLNSERGNAFRSGRPPDLTRTEASLQKIAVYAAVRLLREVAETMPLKFYTGEGADKREIRPPSWIEDLGGDQYGLGDWLGQVTYCDAMRGNVVAKILERDPQTGKPRQLSLQHPDNVDVHRDPETGKPVWRFDGRLVDGTGSGENVWHKRQFAIPGRIMGLSPIGAHALTIGLGISAETYAASFLGGGGHPTAIFQNKTKTLDPDKSATIKSRIMQVLGGNREPLVLGADWDYKPIQISPADAAYLETAGFTSAEAARIFGPGMPAVLGYEVGGSLTYATIEQFNQQLLTFTLDPWLVRLERMIFDLLPRPQFVRFNRNALLRTNLLDRYRAHEIALRNEFTTVNRVLNIEDQPPLEWGDERPTSKTPAPTPVTMEG